MWAFQTSFALYQLGRKEEAAARVEEVLTKYPQDDGGVLTGMQAMFAAAGRDRQRAEERIRSAIKIGEGYQHFHHTTYIIGSAYALMNQPEPALKYLRMTTEDGFPCYPVFERDANLNNLRKDPHFVRFMADLKKHWEYYMFVLLALWPVALSCPPARGQTTGRIAGVVKDQSGGLVPAAELTAVAQATSAWI